MNNNRNNTALKDNLKIQIINNKANSNSNKPKGRNNQNDTQQSRPIGRNRPKEKGSQNNSTGANLGRDSNGNDAVHIIQEFVGVLKDIKEAIPSLKQQQQLQQSQQYQVQSPQVRRQPVKRQRTVEFVSDSEQEDKKFDMTAGNPGQKHTLNDIFAAVSKGDSMVYGYH